MTKENQKMFRDLQKLAKNYQGNTAHHKTTKHQRIKKLHMHRSRLRGLNHEKHLKALRQQNLQR